MRDSCIFYRSFYESINELPDTNKLEIYNAIFSYSLNFIEPELTGLSKSIFTLIKPQLDANIKRFNNGNAPKDKQNKSKSEAKPKQNKSKSEANNNVNDNNKDNDNENNIENRKLKFASTLEPFKSKYGRDMLNQFYKYWTQPNKSNTKFKQELEKTWELSYRLETWSSREKTNFVKESIQPIPKML
jgi:hypothetical protein